MSSDPRLALGLIYAPGSTLAGLAQVPHHALAPLVLAMIGVVLTTVGVLRVQFGAVQHGFAEPSFWIVGAVALAIAWLWLALALGGLGVAIAALSRWGASPLAIKQAFILAPWLWLPLALRDLIGGGYTLVTGDTLPISLAALTSGPPDDPFGIFFWTILWQIDPFWLWHVGLVGAALTICTRVSLNRALDAALLYGTLLLAIHAAAASMSLRATG